MRIHSPSPYKVAQSKSSDYFFNYFTLGLVRVPFIASFNQYYYILYHILPTTASHHRHHKYLSLSSPSSSSSSSLSSQVHFSVLYRFLIPCALFSPIGPIVIFRWSFHTASIFYYDHLSVLLFDAHCACPLTIVLIRPCYRFILCIGHLVRCVQWFGEKVHPPHQFPWPLQL